MCRDGRACWHLDDEVGSVGSVKILPFAMGARRRFAMRLVFESHERRHIAIGYQPNIAAFSSVAAIRSALWHVCFAPK